MTRRFDEVDLRILEALQDDGRKAFSVIARDLGVSEGTVRSRVGRLQSLRVVKFVAEVNPLAMGLTLAYAGVRVRGVPLKRSAEAIAEIPEVNFVVVCLGSYDLLIEIVCADNDDLLDLLEKVRLAKGVEGVDTLTVLQVTKDEYTYSAWARLLDVAEADAASRRRETGR